jgi:AAA domain
MTKDERVIFAFEALRARQIAPEKKDPSTFSYRLVHFDDLQPGCTSPYIVDDLIPCDGLVAVWGPPKSGKSFWTFDLVMHIALGWPYRGRRVEQGPVVYLAFEGAEGFNRRAEAFRRTHEIKERPWFYLLASNAKLVRDHKQLIASIDGQTDRPPTVVVLDTLNRSIDGSESKDQDMGAYLAAAEAIVDEFYCVVIVVHHSGIDASRPRGHTSLSGAANVQIAVRRDAARNVVAEVEMMKDGAEGATFTSSLQVIEVGTDNAGKVMTSCAIVPINGEPAETAKNKGRKLPPIASAALRSLQDCLADMGKAAPASDHIPQGVSCVTLAEWREYLFKHNLVNREGSYREQFKRLHVTLKNAGKIGIWGEQVWTVT